MSSRQKSTSSHLGRSTGLSLLQLSAAVAPLVLQPRPAGASFVAADLRIGHPVLQGQFRSQLGLLLSCFEFFLPEAQPLVLSPEARVRRLDLTLTYADVRFPCCQLFFGSTSEKLVLCILMLALLVIFTPSKTMDPSHPDTLTAGAFILTRRDLYDQVGGHEAIKGCVVDDLNLGRLLKAGGGKAWIGFARHLMHCRMYQGWKDMWEGLTKNAYAGMEYRLGLAVLFVGLHLSANILPVAYLGVSLVWLALGGGALVAWAAGLAAGTGPMGLRRWIWNVGHGSGLATLNYEIS